MFRSIKKVLLAVLLVAPAVALAQQTGSVAGTVVDEATGESLPGANVLIEETTLGAAADIDGNFRIIGVPVGTYNITASFVGYEPVSLTGVEVSASFTRTVEFELATGAELEEVEVVYERPLIERSAVGAPRTVSGDDIQNLPVRGAQSVASLQSGVVAGNDGGLNIRGGRGEEVTYYVDGVRIRGNLAVDNSAYAEQEMLIGTIPAKYGDAQSGVISVTTKTGRTDFFGTLEGYTSEVLDDYGHNFGSFSLGGPIVPGTVGFFLSGDVTSLADASPYGIDHLRLSDEQFDFVQNHPQSLEFENAAGDVAFIPVPADVFDGDPLRQDGGPGLISQEAIAEAMFERGLIPDEFVEMAEDENGNMVPVPAGYAGTRLVNTPETMTEENGFSRVQGKDDPRTSYALTGNLNFDILPTLNLRVGGAFETNDDRNFSYDRSLYNRQYSRTESDYWRAYGTLRQRVSDNAFYDITAGFQQFEDVRYPEGFPDDINQLINYGNVDGNYWRVATRYLDPAIEVEDGDGNVELFFPRRNWEDSQVSVGDVEPDIFTLPNARLATGFRQRKRQTFDVRANATIQLGSHQLEFGGEYQQRTNRFWSITGGQAIELNAQAQQLGVDSYSELPFSVFEDRIGSYYGYTFDGTGEQNEQNLDAYYNGETLDRRVAPWKPFYYGGFVSDRVEFSDLILDVGLRLDAYNANTPVLKDLWGNRPIFRASDAQASGANVPGVVDSDWGVLYSGGQVSNENIVGYRDLDGLFYNANGEQVSANDIQNMGGVHVENRDANITSVFRDSETDFTFMPRLGVSFPVTDRALFFANYNVFAQRPTEQAFAPFFRYPDAGASSRLPNSSLKPEKTIQYELGFRQRIGERAALTISGFYRNQSNKVALRQLDLGINPFGTFLNRDFTTSQGAEFKFQLRRTNHLAIDANYTLAFAKGSGSDASTTGVIAWRGNTFPNFISPADFDQRHTANMTVDYRYGAGEGPVVGGARPFQNLGLNVLFNFASGQRYTPLLNCGRFNVRDSFTCDTRGDINSATLPSTFRVDLKLDRDFDLGFGNSSLKVYLWLQNLLDTRNVFAVHRETGQVDFQDFFAGRLGERELALSPFPESQLFNYDAWVAGPVNSSGNHSSVGNFYGSPRRFRLGVLFNF